MVHEWWITLENRIIFQIAYEQVLNGLKWLTLILGIGFQATRGNYNLPASIHLFKGPTSCLLPSFPVSILQWFLLGREGGNGLYIADVGHGFQIEDLQNKSMSLTLRVIWKITFFEGRLMTESKGITDGNVLKCVLDDLISYNSSFRSGHDLVSGNNPLLNPMLTHIFDAK